MDLAVFLAYQHVNMAGPEAIDEEEATVDGPTLTLNPDYIDAVFNDIDARGGVTLVQGDDYTQGDPSVGLVQFYWPDTDYAHEFGEGLAEGETIVACWQARRGESVVGHVWAYSATTRT
jgi:hypothetical protein